MATLGSSPEQCSAVQFRDCLFTRKMNTSRQDGTSLGIRDAKAITILTLGTLVILVAITGNTLVIVSVSTTRRLRSVTNCFVVSLAIADLLVAILVMPLGIAVEIAGSWPLDRVACDLWISLDVLLCTASILNLCCISVDRYLAITRPLAYSARRSKRLALAMIAVVWIISVAITCPRPAHTIQRFWQDDESDSTECQYTSDQGYVLYSSVGSFFIPLIVMVYVYVCIMRVISKRERILRHRRRRRRTNVAETELSDTGERLYIRSPTTTTTSDSGPDGPSTSSLPEDSASSSSSHSIQNQRHHLTAPAYNGYLLTVASAQRPRRRRAIGEEHASFLREKKAAKTLAVVVGGFIICWLPFFLIYVIPPFCGHKCNFPPLLVTSLTWLGWLNSAINPFIYAFYNLAFRAAFLRLTFGKLPTPLCVCANRKTRVQPPRVEEPEPTTSSAGARDVIN